MRYRAVAEAVGDRAVIQVDGNTGYTIAQAIPALTAMESIGALGAIEQPVARLDDMAEIARRLTTPVMADEAIYPPADAIEVVRKMIGRVERDVAEVNPALCKGCGACVAACRSGALDLAGFTSSQVMAEVLAL